MIWPAEIVVPKERERTEWDEALLSIWRQALVEGAKRVRVGDDSYPVRRTARSKLAQVDFEVDGQQIRGLEQNPATGSRWAKLARKGAKVMQFLQSGRYIAAVSDGKLTRFGPREKKINAEEAERSRENGDGRAN